MIQKKYREVIAKICNKRMFYILGVVILGSYFILSPVIYQFGIDNHNEQLPPIKHMLNASLLNNDWATIENSISSSPRFNYNILVSSISSVFGLWNTFFALWLGSFVITLVFLFKIIRRLFLNPILPFIVIGFLLIPIPLPYLVSIQQSIIYFGGNSLFINNLIPATLANALVLTAFYLILRKKYLFSFLLLAGATILELPIGFWSTIAAGIFVISWYYSKNDFKSWATFIEYIKRLPILSFILYGVIVIIGLIKPLISNLFNSRGIEAMNIMAWVRHPHHYILSTWPTASILTYLGIIIFFVFSFIIIKKRSISIFKDKKSEFFVLLVISILVIAMFVGGYLLTEVFPIGLIISLQPFHIAYIPIIFMLGVIFSYLVYTIKLIVSKITKKNVNPDFFAKALIFGFIFLFIFLQISAIKKNNHFIFHVNLYQGNDYGELGSVYDWIRTNTPKDSRFIVSPINDSFRLGAERAIIVDNKTFIFKPQSMINWYSRINTLCNRTEVEIENYMGLNTEQCEINFNNLSKDEVEKISAIYDATWLLTENPNYDFEKKYNNGKFYIYKIL